MGLKTISVQITGTAPLLMHSPQMMDPENKIGQAIREITKIRNKTIEHHRELSRLEWLGGLYVDAKQRVIVPGSMLEACMVAGAKKVRLGKTFLSAVFVDEDPVLDYPHKKTKLDVLFKRPEYRLVVPVRVQQSRIMRTRPKFPKWSVSFKITFDNEVVDRKAVIDALKTGGQLCAIGDWRPKFGRFTVKVKPK